MLTEFETLYRNSNGSTIRITLRKLPHVTAATQGGSHDFAGVSIPLTALITPEFPHLPNAPMFDLTDRYLSFELDVISPTPLTTYAGDDLIPTGVIHLFNVIVALEWQPSDKTLDTLMRAFCGASNVIYDATNGAMAFGQVIFTGPEYLEKADIQILASNRFHPRSMVNGLTKAEKYSPIRLGRGIWRKERHMLTPWNDSIGYRAIAHEWAHYALGLHDEYIDATPHVVAHDHSLVRDPNGTQIVVPRVLVELQTLMETLDSDELIPLQNDLPPANSTEPQQITALRNRMLHDIGNQYYGLDQKLLAQNPGPAQFPAAFPRFFRTMNLGVTPLQEQIRFNVDAIALNHCWLYTLQWAGDSLHTMAQGSIDDRATADTSRAPIPGAGFELLGLKHNDTILAIGLGLPKQDGVLTPKATLIDISTATPPTLTPAIGSESTWAPVVAVVPTTTGAQWPSMKVRIQVIGTPEPAKVWLSLPGESPRPAIDITQEHELRPATMDGIITLQDGVGTESAYWIAEFSYGGNPHTTVRSPSAPISAGSSDGNLMIFSALDDPSNSDNPDPENYKTCIVTTRNYGDFTGCSVVDSQGNMVPTARPAGYLFSVAACEAVDIAKLHPTIVMYFDSGALSLGQALLIHRYESSTNQWRPLPTYLPPGVFYAATPINFETASNLVGTIPPTDGRIEYYRLFSVPI